MFVIINDVYLTQKFININIKDIMLGIYDKLLVVAIVVVTNALSIYTCYNRMDDILNSVTRDLDLNILRLKDMLTLKNEELRIKDYEISCLKEDLKV